MSKYNSLQAGQLPQGHLSFLQNLKNFSITKYLRNKKLMTTQAFAWMNVAPAASLQLEVQRFINVTQSKGIYVTTADGEVPYFFQKVVFTAQIW